MNKKEFFAALRRALSALPDEERDNVIKYYEDYFLDAEGESDEEVIRGLGDPQKIAEDILRDYRELQPRPEAADGAPEPKRRKGISPWMLLVLVLLVVPLCLLVGVPLAGGLLAVLAGVAATALGILVTVLVALFLIPAGLLAGGLILCIFSFFGWATPPSAVLTLGLGLVLLALGGLAALLLIKLLCLFVPPICRGIVGGLGWICRKIRGFFR